MYLLDTNTIIDFLNAKLPLNANQLLFSIDPKVSVITRIELFSSSKISDKELIALNDFIEIITIYDTINLEIITICIDLRKKYKIKLPDALIAATAIINNLILITRNTKDFENVLELKSINPYEL